MVTKGARIAMINMFIVISFQIFVTIPRGGGGTWIQNDGGVHAYDGFCEPALEKNSQKRYPALEFWNHPKPHFFR